MDLAARLDALEVELQRLRDVEAIRDLLNTYAFNADVGRVEEFLAGWTDDGIYDLLETMKLEGKDQIRDLVSDPAGMQKTMIENRSQHLTMNVMVRVDGDSAWAEGYSIVPLAGPEGIKIFSAAYNHWDFIREGAAWLMTRRLRRVIGGPTWGGDVIKSYLG